MNAPPTPYDRIGGADGVVLLVTRFYDLMSSLPDASQIRAMHPIDIATSRAKLTDFLSGWLGGPPVYTEKHGHPRLRLRHMPFAIDDAARDAWLLCMAQALDECVSDTLLKDQLNGAFRRMASHLRNVGVHQRPEDT